MIHYNKACKCFMWLFCQYYMLWFWKVPDKMLGGLAQKPCSNLHGSSTIFQREVSLKRNLSTLIT